MSNPELEAVLQRIFEDRLVAAGIEAALRNPRLAPKVLLGLQKRIQGLEDHARALAKEAQVTEEAV